jgi:polyketide biosynthesis acyl carrier protein
MTETEREEIARVVHRAIATILPRFATRPIPGDRHLEELGADSVDRVEILLEVLDRLRLEEPMASFSQLPDVDALVDFLCAKTCAKKGG